MINNKNSLELGKVSDCVLSDVCRNDAPDFCDAYISKADYEISREEYDLATGINQTIHNGRFYRELNGAELEWLNEQYDFVYGQIEKWLY